MATSPAVQVDPTSLDTAGVSVATSPPDGTHPRRGSVYDLTTMAAAAPVWFHPIGDGRALMINSRIWTGATPVGGSPGLFSAYTEDTAPTWFLVDGPTGHRLQLPGVDSVHIPMNILATDVTVVGAASRPPNLLFLLNSAASGAILQRLHVDLNASVTVANEEILPEVGEVIFDKGIQYDTPFLVLYGTDSDNRVYRIRKPWGRVGFNIRTNVTISKRTANDAVGSQLGWEYFTGSGYSQDSTELAPFGSLTTFGPMSFGSFRNQVIFTTVAKSGTTYSGQFWISKSGLPLLPIGSPLALGDSSDGSYLGGGIQLLSQLAANPAATAMTAAGVYSGIPYLISTRTGTTNHTLNTVWNIFPVKA